MDIIAANTLFNAGQIGELQRLVPQIMWGTRAMTSFTNVDKGGANIPVGVGGGTVNSVGIASTDFSVAGSPVTAAGNITLNLNNAVVTNAKLSQMAATTLKGNNTGAPGAPLDLTVAQVTAMLDLFTSTLRGLVPLSGGGITNFLRADGSWAAPAGGGGGGNVSNSGTPTAGQVAEWTNATTVQGVAVTGTVNYVKSTSPTLVTPILGTPTSGNLSNCTALPLGSITGLGSGVATFLATPSSANFAAAVTGESGTGAVLFGTAPTIDAATLTGVGTQTGTFIAAGTAMTTVIDFTKPQNNLALSGAPTLTTGGAPVTGQPTLIRVTGDSVARVVTLPAGTWRSAQLNATITTFTVPANWQGYITAISTNGTSAYDIIGEPQALANRGWSRTQTTGANETKTIAAYAPAPGTIVAVYGKTTAGTITLQVRINGVNVTGATCSAATTRATGAASAANTFVAGDVIDLVYSSNSSAANTDATITYAPAGL